jgi:hypothetical protein
MVFVSDFFHIKYRKALNFPHKVSAVPNFHASLCTCLYHIGYRRSVQKVKVFTRVHMHESLGVVAKARRNIFSIEHQSLGIECIIIIFLYFLQKIQTKTNVHNSILFSILTHKSIDDTSNTCATIFVFVFNFVFVFFQ